jgi:3-oxoacyl-[acyl-carrier protein] reductase
MVVKQLADEVGRRGVRVNGLLPGRIATDRIRELDAGNPRADRVAERNAGISLGRTGEPDEFGRVAAFVLSPAASYVTGSMIPVDGGAGRSL